MRRLPSAVLLATVALGVASCGNSQADRLLSGAAIGAGGGVLVGTLAGDPLAGAAIGGVGGAAVGALTNPNQLNLGKPIWRGRRSATALRHSRRAPMLIRKFVRSCVTRASSRLSEDIHGRCGQPCEHPRLPTLEATETLAFN